MSEVYAFTIINYIDFAKYLFRLLLFSLMDVYKFYIGQDTYRTIINILFYSFFLFSISIKYNNYTQQSSKCGINFNFTESSFFVLILIINIIELITWYFNKTPFNAQALDSININIIFTQLPDFVPYFFYILIFCIIIFFFPFYRLIIQIPKISIAIFHFNLLFSFIFILSLFNDFHDKNNKSLFDSYTNDQYYSVLRKILYDKYEMKSQVLSAVKQPKSLLLIQLESFPYELSSDPMVSPNLANFSKRYEIIAPIYTQPYTTWSMAGLAITQTGIPQIYPDPEFKTLAQRTDYEYIIGIKGIPNILKSLNYELNYAVTGKNEEMGFNKWIIKHNYKRIYTAKNDLDLSDFLTKQYLTNIDKTIRESQFANKYLTLVVNTNTHSPYNKPDWCKLSFPKIKEKQKAFYCCDFAVGKIINKFLELKMYEHTLLVVYPDHQPFNTNYEQLFILFPGMEKVDSNFKINDEITYYDFLPTILDLVGIKKYQPECPFGRKVYNNSDGTDKKYCFDKYCIQKRTKPNIDDLAFMYKFTHFEQGKKIKGNYDLNNPFTCLINRTTREYYYSDKPCLTNIRGITIKKYI